MEDADDSKGAEDAVGVAGPGETVVGAPIEEENAGEEERTEEGSAVGENALGGDAEAEAAIAETTNEEPESAEVEEGGDAFVESARVDSEVAVSPNAESEAPEAAIEASVIADEEKEEKGEEEATEVPESILSEAVVDAPLAESEKTEEAMPAMPAMPETAGESPSEEGNAGGEEGLPTDDKEAFSFIRHDESVPKEVSSVAEESKEAIEEEGERAEEEAGRGEEGAVEEAVGNEEREVLETKEENDEDGENEENEEIGSSQESIGLGGNESENSIPITFLYSYNTPQQLTVTMKFFQETPFGLIRDKIYQVFGMIDNPVMTYSGVRIEDNYTPSYCGMESDQNYVVEVQGRRKPAAVNLATDQERTITVTLRDDSIVLVGFFSQDGSLLKEFEVVVVPCRTRKAFIGGYRKKLSGTEYHDATTQTPKSKSDWSKKPRKNHRITQTYEYKTRSCQPRREAGTQMERRDLYIDSARDTAIVSKPYFTADQLFELKLEKTIVIQRYWRKHMAIRLTKKLRSERDARVQDAIQSKEDERAHEQEKHQMELTRRIHPRTAEDFELLYIFSRESPRSVADTRDHRYNELENWRYNRVKAINESGLSKEDRKSALDVVLQEETRLLQNIDKLKLQASKENKEESTQKILSYMSAPKRWAMGDGSIYEIETVFSKRAKELTDLFKALSKTNISVQDRLDVLLPIKWTVKEFDCMLTREIVELIDREADMLHRGRKPSSLAGLRERLRFLFLQFVQSPEFNPEAARFQPVPVEHLERPLIKPIPPSKLKQKTMTVQEVQGYQSLDF